MKLQLFASISFALLSAVPGALCETKVDGLALSSEDVSPHSSPGEVLGDSEDVDLHSYSEDGPDDFEEADSYFSSGDVSDLEVEEQSRRIVSCRGLGNRDCRNQSFCQWDQADRVCLQRSGGTIVSCRGLGTSDCRNTSFCRWDRDDRVCLQRSSGGSSDDAGCGRLNRSDCQNRRESCHYDMRINACIRRRQLDNHCTGLRRRQCGRVSGCKWSKRGSVESCIRVARGNGDDRVNDDRFGNDDRYTDLIGEDLIEDA